MRIIPKAHPRPRPGRNVWVYFDVKERWRAAEFDLFINKLHSLGLLVIETKNLCPGFGLKFSPSQRDALKGALIKGLLCGLFKQCSLGSMEFRHEDGGRPFIQFGGYSARRIYLDVPGQAEAYIRAFQEGGRFKAEK
ncbi:MAG: hypothetical protein K2X03_21200 [Bryobacteraceae bacterium]|nr:hypothetical protein [Bryobacteraceae bacterium]